MQYILFYIKNLRFMNIYAVYNRCIQLENPEKASHTLHLACLLIPPPALAALCYLLQVVNGKRDDMNHV